MLRLLICAALLCVASPARAQGLVYGDMAIRAPIIEAHVMNGEAVLVIAGSWAEIDFGDMVGTRSLVDLTMIQAHVLVDQACYVGFGWGVLHRGPEFFETLVAMDRTGLISSTTDRRLAGYGTGMAQYRLGACGDPWIRPYGPCGGNGPGSCTYGASPLFAAVFRVRLL